MRSLRCWWLAASVALACGGAVVGAKQRKRKRAKGSEGDQQQEVFVDASGVARSDPTAAFRSWARDVRRGEKRFVEGARPERWPLQGGAEEPLPFAALSARPPSTVVSHDAVDFSRLVLAGMSPKAFFKDHWQKEPLWTRHGLGAAARVARAPAPLPPPPPREREHEHRRPRPPTMSRPRPPTPQALPTSPASWRRRTSPR